MALKENVMRHFGPLQSTSGVPQNGVSFLCIYLSPCSLVSLFLCYSICLSVRNFSHGWLWLSEFLKSRGFKSKKNFIQSLVCSHLGKEFPEWPINVSFGSNLKKLPFLLKKIFFTFSCSNSMSSKINPKYFQLLKVEHPLVSIYNY